MDTFDVFIRPTKEIDFAQPITVEADSAAEARDLVDDVIEDGELNPNDDSYEIKSYCDGLCVDEIEDSDSDGDRNEDEPTAESAA